MSSSATALQAMELAGCIIMEYGGETFRVEDTLLRMGTAMQLRQVQCFAVPSGVFISFADASGEVQTGLCRVHPHGTNLTRVDEVNQVSRQLSAGELDAEAALARLEEIARRPNEVSRRLYLLGSGLSAGAFALMFGGGVVEFIVAMVIALLVQLISDLLDRWSLNSMIGSLVGSFLCAFLTMLFHHLTGLCAVDPTVAGELMPLLPGLAMTNAVQDTLRSDYVSGVSHAMQALITAAMVAGGVLIAASLIRLMGGAA